MKRKYTARIEDVVANWKAFPVSDAKEVVRYWNFYAEDLYEAVTKLKEEFEQRLAQGKILSPLSYYKLWIRKVGDRRWRHCLVRGGPNDFGYECRNFEELEDLEERQLRLFKIEKKRFIAKVAKSDEIHGWSNAPIYKFFKAYSLDSAIRKIKAVVGGVERDSKKVREFAPHKQRKGGLSYVKVKRVGEKKWVALFDTNTPEYPMAQWRANKIGKPEWGVCPVALRIITDILKKVMINARQFKLWENVYQDQGLEYLFQTFP